MRATRLHSTGKRSTGARYPDQRPPGSPYIGRFAPSPTGDLHLGTLTAAAASHLHARQAGGRWLVRIEDIDPPREVAGAADRILRTLEALELDWDGEVRCQSARIHVFLEAAERLVDRGQAFRCRCSRRELRETVGDGAYPGTCRELGLAAGDTAVRLRVEEGPVGFEDGLEGLVERDVAGVDGDFVIVRRDGLPAYHLAVVIDDADQGITDIVRGADLLESTPLHILLQRRLGLPTPSYWHIPIVTDRAGEKLSKGTGAAAVEVDRPGKASQAAARTLEVLGLAVPADLAGARPRELWDYAVGAFRIGELAGGPGGTVGLDA